VLFHRSLRKRERVSDGGIALASCHLCEHVELACGEAVKGGAVGPPVGSDERLDHDRVNPRSSLRDHANRLHEIVNLRDWILQEIRTTG
jgi:hypothetical protein